MERGRGVVRTKPGEQDAMDGGDPDPAAVRRAPGGMVVVGGRGVD